jgi:cell division septal protein FtsQ
MKQPEEKLEIQKSQEATIRAAFLVTGTLGVFTLVALAMSWFWDLFASDVHLPEVHFTGAVGILGLLLIVVALVTGAYMVAVKDWGE